MVKTSTYVPSDTTLAGLLKSLDADLTATGLTRRRGGTMSGTAWVEASGRADDGSWLELRLRHRTATNTVEAGLLTYEPLSRGGRTITVGETSATYHMDTSEVAEDIDSAVRGWLG